MKKLHRLTELQNDILAWLPLVVKHCSCFDEDVIKKLLFLRLIKKDSNGNCFLTKKGKKHLKIPSILRAIRELVVINGPVDADYMDLVIKEFEKTELV